MISQDCALCMWTSVCVGLLLFKHFPVSTASVLRTTRKPLCWISKHDYTDIQAAFAPFYTETVLNETITPSDIHAAEAQVDQYGFLDVDDIDAFNEFLYQDKRTAKDKAKMWELLDKALQIINRFEVLEKMEIRATIKRFIRFYSFLIQATCYENVDLHKKYNFLTYLVKEIETGGGGNDFDIADKITASNFRQTKTGDKTSPIESKPEVRLPTPNEVYFDEATKKKLSEIIDEINAAYQQKLRCGRCKPSLHYRCAICF